jgi:hypothetical protein
MKSLLWPLTHAFQNSSNHLVIAVVVDARTPRIGQINPPRMTFPVLLLTSHLHTIALPSFGMQRSISLDEIGHRLRLILDEVVHAPANQPSFDMSASVGTESFGNLWHQPRKG